MYSAGGQKLQTVYKTVVETRNSPVNSVVAYNAVNNDPKTTDYVGNKIYEDGVLKRILVDGGYIDAETNEYHFYITDHLGNNRVVADQSGIAIQKTHYYPFGSAFADSENQGEQPYKYNGKELDKMHGLNMYDYSARHYDAAIGRFTTIDPMAEKGYSWSPYVYCFNNPLTHVDTDGRWGVKIHYAFANRAMLDLGFDKATADRIAYYASTYADQPPAIFAREDHLKYGRFDTQKGDALVKGSQANDGNTWRHAMRSSDDVTKGRDAAWAIDNTITKAWENILNSVSSGDERLLGIGLHALQDISAHQGATYNEHMRPSSKVGSLFVRDLGFTNISNLQKLQKASLGIMTLYGVLTGNERVINNMTDKNGVIHIDLEGITNSNSKKKIWEMIKNGNYNGKTNIKIYF